MSKNVFLVLFLAIGICGLTDWAFEKYLGKFFLGLVLFNHLCIDFYFETYLSNLALSEGHEWNTEKIVRPWMVKDKDIFGEYDGDENKKIQVFSFKGT